jgi:hypothetical protein
MWVVEVAVEVAVIPVEVEVAEVIRAEVVAHPAEAAAAGRVVAADLEVAAKAVPLAEAVLREAEGALARIQLIMPRSILHVP